MTITPQDIQSKQFHLRLRGFDVDEVDRFLEKVAEEFLVLSLEHKQAMERITNMEKEIANFRNKEQAFQSAILSASKISDEMQDKSRRQADEILKKAREEANELTVRSQEQAESRLFQADQEAENIKEKATNQARSLVENSSSRMLQLTGEINRLIVMKGRILADMRKLLGGYLEHLEEGVPPGLQQLEPLPEPEPLDFSPEEAAELQSTRETKAPPVTDETAALEEELDDLYEKIDLADVELENHTAASVADSPPEEEEMATLELADIEALELDDNSDQDDIAITREQDLGLAPDISIPELGDDMLFSLEDPLDELEQSITIRDDNKNG